jgi:glycosyltransferase involved in cell wall biosynthesis
MGVHLDDAGVERAIRPATLVESTVSDPLVSVIVCVYNGERFLAATIESVLAQTWSALELILVDDGSTDGSAALVQKYRDPRLRIISQRNQGTAAALAAGIRESHGEYIAFLDQDDLWREDKLAVHLRVHRERPDIDLTFSWFQVMNTAGDLVGAHSRRYRGAPGFSYLFEDFVIAGSSNVVVRRSAIERAGGVDPHIARLYDVDLFLRIALLASRNIEAVPADLMSYRRHADQITSNMDSWKQEWDMVVDKMRCLAPAEVAAAEHRAASNRNRYLARLEYEGEAYRSGLRYLRAGFGNAPGYWVKDPRNWITAGACLCGWLLPRRMHHALERLAGLTLRS